MSSHLIGAATGNGIPADRILIIYISDVSSTFIRALILANDRRMVDVVATCKHLVLLVSTSSFAITAVMNLQSGCRHVSEQPTCNMLNLLTLPGDWCVLLQSSVCN